MSDISGSINVTDLRDDQALEAANLLAGLMFGATSDEEILESLAQKTGLPQGEILSALSGASAHEIAELSRVVLAVRSEAEPNQVSVAVENTGKKAFVLEAATVGILCLGALMAILSGNKESESETTTIEVGDDGKVRCRTERKTTYGSVGKLVGRVLTAVIKVSGAK